MFRFVTALVFAIMALCLGLCLGLGAAHAERRVALVVGNNNYTNLPADEQLSTAVNDARAVGDTLSRLGFEVIEGENLSRSEFSAKFDELTRKLSPGDTALFYFAGHGVTLGGGNYLLPSDVPDVESGQESLLARTSLGEEDIVTDIQARGVRVAVVVLDACRNNPFKRSGRRSVGGQRGLGQIDAASGVFKLYSAGIGQAALDRLGKNDSNPNSVFTRVLLPELMRPGLDLTMLAKLVGREVQRLASTVHHDQQPAYYDQILDNVYLAGAPSSDQKPSNPTGATPSIGEAEASQKNQVVAMVPPVVQPLPATIPCGTGAVTELSSSRGACPLSEEEERSLKVKDAFKECKDCPDMVVVPAGSFMMGSPEDEKERKSDEGPQREVTIGWPFAVGRFAVTFDEWDACVADGGCEDYRPGDRGWGRGRLPVINVSWDDAKAYVAWLSGRTGKTYRLLSEAEWEYVARAGVTTPFWWGARITPQQANYNITRTYNGAFNGGAAGEYRAKTVPVDLFGANPFGLYQVQGNVQEWVEDCWHESYDEAPADGSAWTTGDCNLLGRVRRGGSWRSYPWDLRAAGRERTVSASVTQSIDTGFRVARTLAP